MNLGVPLSLDLLMLEGHFQRSRAVMVNLDACGVERNRFALDVHNLCALQLFEHASQDAYLGPTVHARGNRVQVAEALG